MDPLEEKITIRKTKSDDGSFMHQGQERTLILKGVTKQEKIVTKFSEKLPSTGIVWHSYSELAKDEKKLVDVLEPDLMKSGDPKSKFAHRWNLHFVDEITGREFYKEFDGKGGKPNWERCDIVFYTDENNVPWKNFSEFLEKLGAVQDDEKPLGTYLILGDKYTATLMLGSDGYLHLDPETLTPYYVVNNETTSETDKKTLSEDGKKLLDYLKTDGDGEEIRTARKMKGWKEVQGYVKSYSEDGIHIKIVD